MRSSLPVFLATLSLVTGGLLGCSNALHEDPGEKGGEMTSGGTVGGGAMGGAMSGGSPSSGGKASGGIPANGGKVAGGATVKGGNVTSGGNTSSGGTTTAGGASGGKITAGATALGGNAVGGNQTGGTTVTQGGSTSTHPRFVGNITTANKVDANGLSYAKYWDQITPENAGKWGSVQRSGGGAFNWATLDAIYDYSEKNNIIFKEHTFVWGAQQPGGTPTAEDVKTWMKEFCKRYPNTKLIDVVNEPPPHTTPSYVSNLGGGTNGDWKWITNAFIYAREACPKAILILNDYNNIEYSGENKHFIDIVKAIKAGGAPIDAVGCQAHDVAKFPIANAKTMLDKLDAETGLPIYITEYDASFSDDNAQLEVYKSQFAVFLNTSYIKGITIWGWIYGQTWGPAASSGLVKGTTFRPAMTWLMEQLKRPTSP